MKAMKTINLRIVTALIIGIICFCAGMVVAQQNEFVIPLSDPAKRGKLKAHLNSGSITVKGTARKDVRVRYIEVKDERASSSNDDKGRNGLRRIGGGTLALEAVESDNVVRIQSNSWNHTLDLEIEVPSRFDVEAHTYNDGDLTLSDLQGELTLTNYNGEITALNISGAVVTTTFNGEIKVTFDQVRADTPMSYSTFNGDIDLTFPSGIRATFKMKTESGDIYTDFDMAITSTGPKQTTDKKSGAYKIVVDDWKVGQVNGGGPEFTMKNYNGDIILRKK